MSLNIILLVTSLAATFYTIDQPERIPQNEPVEVRGFAYQVDDKTWVLAPEPNVKSCCLEKASAPRVYIAQDINGLEANRAYTFSGKLQQSGQRYVLADAQVLSSNRSGWYWLPLVAALAAFGLRVGIKRRR